MAGTVFVSGGSGYIAGFLIRQLVAEGWIVHTTIRNLAREGQVRESLGVDNSRVKFFAADLTSDAGWDEAMAGCSHVAHLASPLPTDAPSHEDELIVPARDGALRALRAARAAGIKRFVMTSSMAAVAYGHGGAKTRFTEADWTNIDSPDAYAYVKSKTIAERAARDWVAAEGGDMEFCTVNPVLVLGPLQSADFSTSLEAIKKMLEGSLPGLPRFGFGVVDVRDVADMHLRCLDRAGHGGRTLPCARGPSCGCARLPRSCAPGWVIRPARCPGAVCPIGWSGFRPGSIRWFAR
ncbi:MAG: NAD-dependent epimerase/dehydratase family protein [Novosphingobium sp.]